MEGIFCHQQKLQGTIENGRNVIKANGSTEVDKSAATSLKTCQKSLSTKGAAVKNEKSLIPERRTPCFPLEMALGQSSHAGENGRIEFTRRRPRWKQRELWMKGKKTIAGFFSHLLRKDSPGCRLGAWGSLGLLLETPPVDKRKADTSALAQIAVGSWAS